MGAVCHPPARRWAAWRLFPPSSVGDGERPCRGLGCRQEILPGSSGCQFLGFVPFPVAWGMLLGTRRAVGKGSTRELVFPLSQAAGAVLELRHQPGLGICPLLGRCPICCWQRGGKELPLLPAALPAPLPAALPAALSAALPAALPPLCCLGSPPGQVTCGPGASQRCEAWPRTKASSPAPSGDWGHSPVVLVAAGASLLPCSAQCLQEQGRPGWAAGKLACPQASGLAPQCCFSCWGAPAVAAVRWCCSDSCRLSCEGLNRFE